MNLPHTILSDAAQAVLPGSAWIFGERELANVEIDKISSADRIVYLDDFRTPYQFVTNRYQQVTGVRYSCLLMLLVPSDMDDTPAQRLPRVGLMVDASARLLAALAEDDRVQAVKQVRPAETLNIGPFDRPVDGVVLFLDLTPAGGLDVCLPAEQPQV